MTPKSPSRPAAIFQALLVTFLWSTSWVLIKIGLAQIPALTFAGLRYSLACLCLLPFLARRERRIELKRLSGRDWARLAVLGVLYYTATQGSQFLGLVYLPAVSVSLVLNFSSVLVAWLGILFLTERPSLLQWAGMGLFLAGALVYFYPVSFPASQWFGLAVVLAGVVANALASVLGRSLNRRGDLSPLVVTTTSMGIGAALLLAAGLAAPRLAAPTLAAPSLALPGLPALDWKAWLILAWLAVVNTAFAFTLWNHTLRTLTAMESSILNNTMLVQIALLAWLFLGESLTLPRLLGMALAGAGALVVQLRK